VPAANTRVDPLTAPILTYHQDVLWRHNESRKVRH